MLSQKGILIVKQSTVETHDRWVIRFSMTSFSLKQMMAHNAGSICIELKTDLRNEEARNFKNLKIT